MENSPKSMRLQIALFGRTNVGKSSLINLIAGQDVAIVSNIPGTTTDIVEKSLELLPIGPINLLDTSGIDDTSELGKKRIEKTIRSLSQADIAIIVTEPNVWTKVEENLANLIISNKLPLLVIINKCDKTTPDTKYLSTIEKFSKEIIHCSARETNRTELLNSLKNSISAVLPEAVNANKTTILGDLVPTLGGLVVLITPIDSEAPKGRLILPQVQTLRDCLDNGISTLVVRETEYAQALKLLARKPDLVVCDSQVVDLMVRETPQDIACTTFSILFSRLKGDFNVEVAGAMSLENIQPDNKILIAEACSHHAQDDDIGTVKIPQKLRKYLGFDVQIDHVSGRDYPLNLADYSLIIQCGSCMLTPREKMNRIQKAVDAGVPITNYGMVLSYTQGVLKRVLSPFKELRNR